MSKQPYETHYLLTWVHPCGKPGRARFHFSEGAYGKARQDARDTAISLERTGCRDILIHRMSPFAVPLVDEPAYPNH